MTKTTNSQKIDTKADGTTQVPVTIPKAKIKTAYQQVLKSTAQKTNIKGFRQGKAPLDVVEKNLDRSKLYNQVLQKLLPQLIDTAIKTHHLKPIASPRLKPISIKEGEDWQLILEFFQFPKFGLGKYKHHVRGALRATKIWVPGQDEPKKPQSPSEKKDDQTLANRRLQKVFDALIDNIKVPIAPPLIEEEVNRALSKLLTQVQKLGLTIDQYLESLNKTTKSIREEYQKTAETNLKLEFILQKIAEDLKVQVKDEEIDHMIKAIPNDKTKKSFSDPTQRAYVKAVIRKRKAVDKLLSLG